MMALCPAAAWLLIGASSLMIGLAMLAGWSIANTITRRKEMLP